jgi:hypothetical protein
MRLESTAALVSFIFGIACTVFINYLYLHRQGNHNVREVDGFITTNPDAYRNDLRQVVQKLRKAWADGARVLATNDTEVLTWWTTFVDGTAVLPDSFTSALSDYHIEQGIIQFAKTFELTPLELQNFLETRRYMIWFLGAEKYQASRIHQYAPLSDYSPEQRVLIEVLQPPLRTEWQVFLPKSELSRILSAYQQAESAPSYQPDVIVLLRDEYFQKVTRRPVGYERALFNSSFEMLLPDRSRTGTGQRPR